MYKKNLASNNLQWLIWHETKQTEPRFFGLFLFQQCFSLSVFYEILKSRNGFPTSMFTHTLLYEELLKNCWLN